MKLILIKRTETRPEFWGPDGFRGTVPIGGGGGGLMEGGRGGQSPRTENDL